MIAGIWLFIKGLGLAKLATYIGAGLLTAGVLFGSGYLKGRMDAHSNAKIASLRAELAVARQDLNLQRHVAKVAQEARDAEKITTQDLKEQVSSYEEDVAKLTTEIRACRAATPADIRRLRAIVR
jgi:hypothetical protein